MFTFPSTEIPNSDAFVMECAALDDAMSDLLGMQPVHVQSPPNRSFSIMTTDFLCMEIE